MGDFAPHHTNTYAQTYTPNHTAARGHSTTHPTTHSNSYTRGKSSVQYMGNYRPNPRSPSNGWRGVLLPEKAEVKASGITVVCFGLLCINAR